jgi:hypothetical protein
MDASSDQFHQMTRFFSLCDFVTMPHATGGAAVTQYNYFYIPDERVGRRFPGSMMMVVFDSQQCGASAARRS